MSKQVLVLPKGSGLTKAEKAQLAEADIIVVEVKTPHEAGTYDVKTKCFRANFSRHRRGGKRVDYNPQDVDFFAVYCAGLPELNIYLIPAGEIKNRCPRLFPHRARVISYAGKSTLERFLNAFEALK